MTQIYRINIAKKDYFLKTKDSLLKKILEKRFFTFKVDRCFEKEIVDFDYYLKNYSLSFFSKITYKKEDVLEFLLVVILQMRILKDKIILMHASSFYFNNYSYLFIGQSGKGKSTLINKVKKDLRLSDDIAVIKKEKKAWHCYSSPFEKKKVIYNPEKKYQIKKLFFLKHSNEEKIVKIAFSNLLKNLFENSLYLMSKNLLNKFYSEKKSLKKSLLIKKLLIDLSIGAESYFFYFRKDTNPQPFISFKKVKKS